MKFITSFSGGKDSMLAMHRMIDDGNVCVGIMTTTNQDIGSWFHDIDITILEKIANSLNVDFIKASLSSNEYSELFEKYLLNLKDKYDIESVIFGDIDIIEHRMWCEKRCENTNLLACFPLWNEDRKDIVLEFIDLGYQAIIKRIAKEKIPSKYLGEVLSYSLIEDLEKLDIDICGENGEYHTLVYNGPLFERKVDLELGSIIETENSFVLDVTLKDVKV